ncbi:HET and Ankyrin domain protein, partial [Aspergillus nomiae NRRL 13137]
MRLLKTTKSNVGAFEIEEFADDQLQNQPYAILSHTWGSDEVTLQNINEPIIKSRVGYRKVEQCCSIAHEMGAELSEAINSMFLWYQEATICYAYLFDVPQEPFERSRWFTRGWTLQELIAPREMVFYDGNWKKLGDKASLGTRISRCTRIPESILLGDQDLDTFSIAQRMSWAAERQTSRVEDRAYCLMGLFGVNMPLIYGEREGAFIRLQEEILRISEDHSLFAWKSSDTRAGLLATSPAAFIDSYDIVPHDTIIGETSDTFYSPLIISGKGIHLDLCQIGLEHVGLGLAVLQCKKVDGGSTAVAIFVHDPSLTLERFKRVYCGNFHHLDLKRFNKSQLRMTRMCIQAGRMTRLQRIGSSEEYNMSLPINIYPIATLARALNWNHPQVDVHVWLMLTQSRPESSLNKVYSGRTPLSWAAENGLENYARSLLKRGAGTEVNDKLFHSPLCWASLNGHTAVVKLLLDKGASTKAAGPDGRTPLMHCSYAGHEDIASVLIDTGADINAEDRYGDVPLIHAILADNVSIVKILIAKGADINIKGVGGRIPLIHAILADNVSIVKILIDKGADINVKCANGRVPLIYAVLAHNVSI